MWRMQILVHNDHNTRTAQIMSPCLTSLAHHCRDTLEHRREGEIARMESHPKLAMLRRCSISHVNGAVKALGQRVGPGAHPELKQVKLTFTALANTLNTGYGSILGAESPRRPFAPLERCNRKTCLCSVHKASHRLRVCKGCWVVAYCNSHCQSE